MTDLPAPLVPADVDLRDFAFMPLDVSRLRDSELASSETPEACWAAVLLWAASWHQLPAASLPNADDELARLCGYSSRAWARVRQGALRGWILCTDGRLYHPVIAEKAVRAWTRHHRLRHAATRASRPKRIKGWRWQAVRARVFDRDGRVCKACGSVVDLEVDHIKPLAGGGTHHDSNLQVLCLPCNRRKSSKVAV